MVPTPDPNKSGAGFTVDNIKEALKRGALLEPFNQAYMKISMKRPEVNLKSMSGWNRFFAEGAPEFNLATLVQIEIAEFAMKQ